MATTRKERRPVHTHTHHLGLFDFSGRASALAENFKLPLLDTFIRCPYFSWIFPRYPFAETGEEGPFYVRFDGTLHVFFFCAGQKPRSSRIGTVFSHGWKFLIAAKKKEKKKMELATCIALVRVIRTSFYDEMALRFNPFS